jgi:hypothetical protein
MFYGNFYYYKLPESISKMLSQLQAWALNFSMIIIIAFICPGSFQMISGSALNQVSWRLA